VHGFRPPYACKPRHSLQWPAAQLSPFMHLLSQGEVQLRNLVVKTKSSCGDMPPGVSGVKLVSGHLNIAAALALVPMKQAASEGFGSGKLYKIVCFCLFASVWETSCDLEKSSTSRSLPFEGPQGKFRCSCSDCLNHS
jgi:hypothetical protein